MLSHNDVENAARKGRSEYTQRGKWHGGKSGQLARQMAGAESGIVSPMVYILKHPVPENRTVFRKYNP